MQHQASALPSATAEPQCGTGQLLAPAQHSPSPPRLTAQGAGLPGHLLLPADQWLPKGCPSSLCPMTHTLGSQGSQSWGVLAVQEARDALCSVLHNLQSTLGSKCPSASLPSCFLRESRSAERLPSCVPQLGFSLCSVPWA